jgi:hypothetical protein
MTAGAEANCQIRELNFPVDTFAEISDGLLAFAIMAFILRCAWLSHNKEADAKFSPRD